MIVSQHVIFIDSLKAYELLQNHDSIVFWIGFKICLLSRGKLESYWKRGWNPMNSRQHRSVEIRLTTMLASTLFQPWQLHQRPTNHGFPVPFLASESTSLRPNGYLHRLALQHPSHPSIEAPTAPPSLRITLPARARLAIRLLLPNTWMLSSQRANRRYWCYTSTRFRSLEVRGVDQGMWDEDVRRKLVDSWHQQVAWEDVRLAREHKFSQLEYWANHGPAFGASSTGGHNTAYLPSAWEAPQLGHGAHHHQQPKIPTAKRLPNVHVLVITVNAALLIQQIFDGNVAG